jgi:isocitrate/isopropylmalate dehydrogenase
VREAVRAVLAEGQARTRDLGGTASTEEMAEAIALGAKAALARR